MTFADPQPRRTPTRPLRPSAQSALRGSRPGDGQSSASRNHGRVIHPRFVLVPLNSMPKASRRPHGPPPPEPIGRVKEESRAGSGSSLRRPIGVAYAGARRELGARPSTLISPLPVPARSDSSRPSCDGPACWPRPRPLSGNRGAATPPHPTASGDALSCPHATVRAHPGRTDA